MPTPDSIPQENESSKRPKVLIVGAGIGGLTLGILLQKAGYNFQIFEKATEIKPLGKGGHLLHSLLLFVSRGSVHLDTDLRFT